jgi:hypothetical protein
MTDDPDRIPRMLEQMAAELRQRPRVRDWVDAYHDGSAFGSDVAAVIYGCSPDTIRRRAVDAAAAGQPLGILQAGVWLFDLRRLLNWIEQHQGKPARLAAESRARKNAEMRLSLQNRPLAISGAAVAAR